MTTWMSRVGTAFANRSRFIQARRYPFSNPVGDASVYTIPLPATPEPVQAQKLPGPEATSTQAQAPATATPSAAKKSSQQALATEPTKTKKAQPQVTKTLPTVRVGEWRWPTRGKVIGAFGRSGRKGIDVAGRFGQPVVAAAGGKVVYSGGGLIGYGELIIVKHNKQYLSAYAHNSKLLVQEGAIVKGGQRIAEMGRTGADQVKLHFEIRRNGKPVDPIRYLPK